MDESASSKAGVPEEAETVDGEVVEALPVVAEVRALERASRRPAVQMVAAAATGFVAGAAALALVRAGSRARGAALPAESLPPLRPAALPGREATRTYLVNVRLIEHRGG